MTTPAAARRSLLFRVTDDALYVANFGRKFSRPGVVSVCRENLSAKSQRGPGSSLDGVADRDLIDAIRNRRLDVYRTDLDQLQEDANHERETSSDYAGRSLWELLQNADDALAPAGTSSADLIGAKGLGFKSVLEITDRPSIHSGSFDFGFDAALSWPALHEIDPAAPALTFRLPHKVARDDVSRSLLKQGFATVIRLPFRSATVKAEVMARLDALAPHFLLLCRNLDTVTVEVNAVAMAIMTVTRPRALTLRGARAVLRVTRDGVSHETNWRLWSSTAPAPQAEGKTLSAAIALRTIDDQAVPADDDIPVHVFFPTVEAISARFLVHGSFALTSNRNNIRTADHDAQVRTALQTLVTQAISDISPRAVVEVFGSIVRAAPTGRARRPERLLQQAIAEAVTDAAFVRLIGGGRARPGDVHTWDHDLDQLATRSHGGRLGLPTRDMVPVFTELRTIFGAEPLRSSDYAAILSDLKVDTRDKAVRAIRITYAACLATGTPAPLIDMLASAPIWPTDDGRFRSLTARPPLLRQRPPGWAAWLDADALHGEAYDLLESYDAAATQRWAILLGGRLLRTRDEWLSQALAPELAGWDDEDWEKSGYDALRLIDEWATIQDYGEIAPLVEMPNDVTMRLALASVARVPTRTGWVVSRSAYAGRELNGIAELANYFRDVPGRAIVNAPTKAIATFGAKRWKALLRFLGVSWEPKIQFVGRDAYLNQPSSYAFHSASVGLVHVNQEWYIEHFPQCLEALTAPQIAACVSTLAAATQPLQGRWRKMAWADRAHAPEPFTSFADFQLKRERYLPQRAIAGLSGGRFAPHELFWPGRGIAGITPILDVGTINRIRRGGLKPVFIKRLGVRDALPLDWRRWTDWSDELLKRITAGQRVSTKAVRGFYDAMLRIPERATGTPPLSHVAATYPDRDGDVIVAPSSDVLWIDNGRFENHEVLSGLGQRGKAILPVRLDRGEGAPSVLGVRPASAVLAVEPRYEPASERRSRELARRIAARRGALAAICRSKNLYLKKVPALEAVNDLRLRISFEGAPLADRSAPSFLEDGRWLINLQSGEKWEAVAAAVAEPFGLHGSDLKYRFARILRASRDEVAAILADDGIPQYRIREALTDLDEDEASDDAEAATDNVSDDAPGAAAESGGQQGNGTGEEDDVGGNDGDDHDDDADEDADPDDEDDDSSGGQTDRDGRGNGNDQSDHNQSSGRGRTGQRQLKRRKLFGGGGGEERQRRRRAAAEAAEAAARNGLRAEAWLMREIAETLGDTWTCCANVRDDDLRETDLLLTRGDAEFHIEVKSLASERIYWSELERENAVQFPGRYFMALLVERDDDRYSVRWLWDPLVDLAALPRRIEWLWRNAEEGPSVSEGWQLESGIRWPQRTADRYIHVVQVTQEHLETLEADGNGLPHLVARIARG